ncbi:hypothetical protein ACIQC9_01395 [Brevundimonas sp. NPDC092305]|uniref:hypothetical protein n=1 Tax=Brevundimonas sp. NPDC092305 TaxID=3363957 RepID=UPI003811CB76
MNEDDDITEPNDPGPKDPEQFWLFVALWVVTGAMLIACGFIAFMEISGRA